MHPRVTNLSTRTLDVRRFGFEPVGALGSDNEYSGLAAEPAPYIGFVRRCSRCRKWAAGNRPRWCDAMRIWRRIICRLTRNAYVLCVPLQSKIKARFCHSPENSKGLRYASP
jgi:hypothetical protein